MCLEQHFVQSARPTESDLLNEKKEKFNRVEVFQALHLSELRRIFSRPAKLDPARLGRSLKLVHKGYVLDKPVFFLDDQLTWQADQHGAIIFRAARDHELTPIPSETAIVLLGLQNCACQLACSPPARS